MKNQVCTTDGNCKTSNKVYGIVNPTTNKIHRLTFSESLAYCITATIPGDYEVQKFNYILGKRLDHDEKSSNGLYAIVSNLRTSKGLCLRISCTQESAQLMTPDDYRGLAEVWLIP